VNWFSRLVNGEGENRDASLSLDEWASWFQFGGLQYPFMGGGHLAGDREEIGSDFEGIVQGAYKGNGVIFACMLARALLFTEARFRFRRESNGRPGDLFGSPALRPLERPGVNKTTGDILGRAIQDVDLAGNFFAHRPDRRMARGRVLNPGQEVIRRMRPDWVTIILGSEMEPQEDPSHAIDAECAGYLYHPGGRAAKRDPILLWPEEVAHFAPIPDPTAHFRGMSWITPVIREVMGDTAATKHKLKFFENGATPNVVVTANDSVKNEEKFERWVAKMKLSQEGLRNAYRTLYLAHGSEAKVIGSDLKQVDFKVTQGAGETRIAAAAGVPPSIVGLSEGLQGSSLNAGNFGAARRRFADLTMRPLWRNVAGSLSNLIDVPNGAELWYDDRDIPALQEDAADEANIQQTQAATIKSLIDAGYKPETVVASVTSGDFSKLVHTGLFSVQLQPPGTKMDGSTNDAPASDDDAAGRAMRALLDSKR
jgi:phage portal protein BeeE